MYERLGIGMAQERKSRQEGRRLVRRRSQLWRRELASEVDVGLEARQVNRRHSLKESLLVITTVAVGLACIRTTIVPANRSGSVPNIVLLMCGLFASFVGTIYVLLRSFGTTAKTSRCVALVIGGVLCVAMPMFLRLLFAFLLSLDS